MQGKFQYWETNMPIKSVSPTLVTVSFLVFFLVKIVTSADFRDEYAISPRGGGLEFNRLRDDGPDFYDGPLK